MKLLLDTHVWLWFVRGDTALPRAFEAAIRDEQNDVALSVISPWEVQLKAALGKISVRGSVAQLVDESSVAFDLLDVSMRHVRELASLPMHHRDPFDRMLVAQARADGYTFVSVDEAIAAYDVPQLSAAPAP